MHHIRCILRIADPAHSAGVIPGLSLLRRWRQVVSRTGVEPVPRELQSRAYVPCQLPALELEQAVGNAPTTLGWKPSMYLSTLRLLKIGAPTRNRTQFTSLQGKCIASNAFEA